MIDNLKKIISMKIVLSAIYTFISYL